MKSEAIKNEILKRSDSLGDGAGVKIKKPDGTSLIVTYSRKRARKDKYNARKDWKN